MKVDFFFDPICPWCWITSRWLHDVAGQREIDISWRSFSLAIKNADQEWSERARLAYETGLAGLRAVEAVRDELGNDAVGELYGELGRRYHIERERPIDIDAAIAAAGLPLALAEAATDAGWDTVIESSMKEAIELVGDDIGVPTIVFDGRHGFFGPVLSPAPTGSDAVELFDLVAALARREDFFELKRGRSGRPQLTADG